MHLFTAYPIKRSVPRSGSVLPITVFPQSRCCPKASVQHVFAECMNGQVATGKGQPGKGPVPIVGPVGLALSPIPAWQRCRRRALTKRPLIQGRVASRGGGCMEPTYRGGLSQARLSPSWERQAEGDRMQTVCRIRVVQSGKQRVGGAAGCGERVGYWNSPLQRWSSFSC